MGTTVDRRDDIKEAYLSADPQDNTIPTLSFVVGVNGVTMITQGAENGEYCEIPYIRVWRDDVLAFEAAKHRFARIYY